jgi:hypothetical protein
MNEERSGAFPHEVQALLEAIADKLPQADAESLRHDIRVARVTPDSDFLTVELPGYDRPEYRGHHNLPFEGRMHAADGGAMTVLVNMDENDRLLEVEFIRWESLSNVAPDWSTLTIVPKPPLGVSKW